jgi:hypothetical protein
MVNLLVGWLMGLSMLAAASTWAALQWQTDRQIVQRSHAQHDLRSLMDTVVHDLRRAQYQSAANDFQVSAHQVLFSINRNDNGLRDNNECSGFRLNGAALQTQTACQPATWSTLNDIQSLKVQALNFRWECNNASRNQGDSLWIEIQSQAPREAVTTNWQRVVRLRNVASHQRPSATPCNNAA